MTELEEDWERARKIANQVTPETQTIEDAIVDIVRQLRDARRECDRLNKLLGLDIQLPFDY